MNLEQARKAFLSLSITHFCDADSTQNVRVLDSGLRSFTPNPKMLGLAYTVKTEGDLLAVIKALESATDEHVLMIHSGNSAYAMAGEIFSSEAKRKKIAGIVIDGFCRDTASISQIGLPFYARGICPKACSKKKLGNLNVPIQCGGITISPGDVILGDEDGLIAIKLEEFPALLVEAIEIAKREALVLKKIHAGTSFLDLVNFSEHYEKIAKGEESLFKWK